MVKKTNLRKGGKQNPQKKKTTKNRFNAIKGGIGKMASSIMTTVLNKKRGTKKTSLRSRNRFNGVSGSVSTAPAAVFGRPKAIPFHATGINTYAGCEMIQEVTLFPGNSSFQQLYTYLVSPTNQALFPKLAQISPNFERYKVKHFRVMFSEASSTANNGLLSMQMEYDPSSTDTPINLQQVMQFETHSYGPFYEPQTMSAKMARLQQAFYLSVPDSTKADERLQNAFILNVFASGWNFSVPTTVGQIWVDYSFELLDPANPSPTNLCMTSTDLDAAFTFIGTDINSQHAIDGVVFAPGIAANQGFNVGKTYSWLRQDDNGDQYPVNPSSDFLPYVSPGTVPGFASDGPTSAPYIFDMAAGSSYKINTACTWAFGSAVGITVPTFRLYFNSQTQAQSIAGTYSYIQMTSQVLTNTYVQTLGAQTFTPSAACRCWFSVIVSCATVSSSPTLTIGSNAFNVSVSLAQALEPTKRALLPPMVYPLPECWDMVKDQVLGGVSCTLLMPQQEVESDEKEFDAETEVDFLRIQLAKLNDVLQFLQTRSSDEWEEEEKKDEEMNVPGCQLCKSVKHTTNDCPWRAKNSKRTSSAGPPVSEKK